MARFVILRRVYPWRPICPAVDKTPWQWRPMAVGRQPSLRADMPRPVPFPLNRDSNSLEDPRIDPSSIHREQTWICTRAALRSIVIGGNFPGEEFCDFFFLFHIYICISFFEKCVSIIELYNYIYCIFEVSLIISILKLQVAKKKRRNKIEVGEKRCIFNYINIRVKRSREFIIFFNLMKRLKSNFKVKLNFVEWIIQSNR